MAGNSRFPAAASNGSVAAVAWQDHYCMAQEVMFARFNEQGDNLQGEPLGTSTVLYVDRIRKASITNYCTFDPKSSSMVWCGWAQSPALAYATGGRFGVAAHVVGFKSNCANPLCAPLLGCKHIDVTQIHFFLVQANPWKSPQGVQVSVSNVEAREASLVWSGKEFAVAWTDRRHDDQEIYFRRIKADASGLSGPEVRITSAPFDSSEPVLRWHGSGYGLAWQDSRLMTSQIYFASLDAQGRLSATEQRAVTGGSSGAWKPSLAWDGKRYGLAWEDARDGHLEVYFKLLDSAGKVLSTALRVSEAGRHSTVTPQAYSPKLVFGLGGEFGLAWISNKSYTDSQNMLRQKKGVYFARVRCP